jgi:enoyl-CoA hydratase/carnithine racemase
MALAVSHEGFVATVSGAAGVPVADVLDLLLALSGEDAARVVVLDLTVPPTEAPEPAAAAVLRAIQLSPLPLVAALAGEVTGAALDLACAADIRVCDADTVLRFVTFGTRRQLVLLGQAGSVDLLRQGGRFDARAAFAAGLVTHVAAPGNALADARAVAGTVAARGPIATRMAKEAVWRGLEMPFSQALRFETDLTLLLQTTKDRAEGVQAFLEKRPPSFTGS